MSILTIPMQPRKNDAKAKTIGEYLSKLLCKLLVQKYQFDGKRPFGNGQWNYELYAALIKAKVINGSLDEDGYVDEVDERAADILLLGAVQDLFGTFFTLKQLKDYYFTPAPTAPDGDFSADLEAAPEATLTISSRHVHEKDYNEDRTLYSFLGKLHKVLRLDPDTGSLTVNFFPEGWTE